MAAAEAAPRPRWQCAVVEIDLDPRAVEDRTGQQHVQQRYSNARRHNGSAARLHAGEHHTSLRTVLLSRANVLTGRAARLHVRLQVDGAAGLGHLAISAAS